MKMFVIETPANSNGKPSICPGNEYSKCFNIQPTISLKDLERYNKFYFEDLYGNVIRLVKSKAWPMEVNNINLIYNIRCVQVQGVQDTL